MISKPKILVSNDDGVHSEGISGVHAAGAGE
jgi:broad specificity polyphosphatase/5'/3'-nucleotidase SurE